MWKIQKITRSITSNMTNDELRQIFEEIDPEGKISQTTLEELMVALNGSSFDKMPEVGPTGVDLISLLQDKLKGETDWKRRAAIAAKIISANLDT